MSISLYCLVLFFSYFSFIIFSLIQNLMQCYSCFIKVFFYDFVLSKRPFGNKNYIGASYDMGQGTLMCLADIILYSDLL